MHDILKEAGVKGEGERFGLVFLLGLLKTVATYMAGTRLDKSGRRPMLLASLTIMFIGLLQLTASLSTSSLTWLALLGVSVYFVGFSIGVGPVCWLYASEIYPTRLRPLLMSMCTVANRIAGTIVAGTVTTVEGVTGVGGYYGILAGITAVSWVGVWGLVREVRKEKGEGGSMDDHTLRKTNGASHRFVSLVNEYICRQRAWNLRI